jgi:adenylosuccinate synthase
MPKSMNNQISAVVGIQWGDEGKGRMIDYLAQDSDFVVRYQGGNNAGHTVVNKFGSFKLHLVPSGIFSPDVTNVLGPGMVIDIQALCEEIEGLVSSGINTSNIRLSDRATICFPFNRQEDGYEEERLGKKAYGSTKKGIAPAYRERYAKKSIQIGELLYPEQLKKRLEEILDWKNLIFQNVYKINEKINIKEVFEWTENFGNKIKPYICDTSELLISAANNNKKILFEAQLGALRDVFYGIYPFTTSSSVLSSYAYIGSGLFNKKINHVIGVMKAFSTCVGAGPFVTEMKGEVSDKLREIAYEYGAATGRPRRIGHFDAVASKYGAAIQDVDCISLTKLDSLSQQKSLFICTDYKYKDKLISRFPINPVLNESKPVYTELEGWNTDISDCRDFYNLPKQARAYVLKIEELVGYPIKYISVGPERDSIIIRDI